MNRRGATVAAPAKRRARMSWASRQRKTTSTTETSGRPHMRSLAPIVVLLAVLPVMGACTDGVSEPEATQTAVLAAATPVTTPATTSRRSRPSTSRALVPSQTNIHPRATAAEPNVDLAIPFDRPANAAQPMAVSVASPVAEPGTVTPALPLGPGAQRPTSTSGLRVVCTSAPALKLACPSDAPTPSTCTSADNLPAGCHAIKVPGALCPDNAVPACCS